MIYWANVLHIYQPPTQEEGIVKRIIKESYQPLVEGIIKNPSVKITLNINASLTYWLVKLNYQRIISKLAQAVKRGQVELLSSAAYHPILPLLPLSETKRQIMLNLSTNRKFFGDVYKVQGFFLPEMAYSRPVGELIADLGFKYIILDQIAYSGRYIKIPFDRLYYLKSRDNLAIFFRSREASDAISFGRISKGKDLIKTLGKHVEKKDHYLITAMDGETYGHHQKGLLKILFDTYQYLGQQDKKNNNDSSFFPVTLSELSQIIDKMEKIEPLACNWSADPADIAGNKPFCLWQDKDNDVHKLLWQLVYLAISVVEGEKIKDNDDIEKIAAWQRARELLDQGLHSDQFWWASGYRHKRMVGSVYFWHPGMVRKGARLLLTAVSSHPLVTEDLLAQARDIYLAISQAIESWRG